MGFSHLGVMHTRMAMMTVCFFPARRKLFISPSLFTMIRRNAGTVWDHSFDIRDKRYCPRLGA